MDNQVKNIFNYAPDLLQHIQWQYDNAPVIQSLAASKNSWYSDNLTGFWQNIAADFLDINTANDWGLNLWGKILQVKRLYNVNGEQISLSTELYRRLILAKLQLIKMNGTVPEINSYLNFIFAPYATETSYAAYVQDNRDMTVSYIINFDPTDEELALIQSRSIFPTPAGVEDNIIVLTENAIFGFEGSGFQPWNQAPFWSGEF